MKNHFKITLIWIIAGLFIGSAIGIIGVGTNTIIRLCFGGIVLLADILCIYGLLRPAILNSIDKNGEQVIGKIENITVMPRPDQISEDHWVQKARFAFTVSYEVASKKYRKEYPPTCLTSKQELYPQVIEVGEPIPIKYYKKAPRFSLADVDVLKAGSMQEQKKARVLFIMILILMTVLYAFATINNII